MRRILIAGRVLAVGLLVTGLNACSWLNDLFPDRSKDYKQAQTSTSLEVPPDLTATQATDVLVVPEGSTTLSGYTSARETLTGSGGTAVLPVQEDIRFERSGDQAWVVVEGEPSTVWPKARQFWIENGYLIVLEDPAIGVLQTDWTENRAAIPSGPIRSVVGRVLDSLYTSAYQDRYRMRLERGTEPGTTELYITHQGVEEIVTDATGEGATRWRPRPRDPGLESAMLKRMMIFLGVTPRRAEQVAQQPIQRAARAELVQRKAGDATLVVHETYPNAWRSVGIALDQVDFAVEDRDRSAGIYYVRYNDPLQGHDKGFLSKLAFWADDEEKAERYQVKLNDDGVDTRVTILDAEGNTEKSDTAVRILSLLYEALR
jgi:outer membrane protein assembly factor BamC